MVNKLAEIEPRSSGETTVENSDTGEAFFRPEQLRDTFIFASTLDEYAEVTIEATHSNDTAFNEGLINEQGLPLRPGDTREKAYTDSNELVKFVVDTPTAPTSGSLTIWREKDQTPLPLDSTRLKSFKELNEGRSYAVDMQDSVTNDETIAVGIRLADTADSSVFVRQFGISVGADALVTTAIDHGSYTDGTALAAINKKPELQTERPLEATVTRDPTTSNPQESITAFLPGGSAGGTATGNRFAQAEYELSPGQDMTITVQNISGNSDRFGFSLEIIETVIR